MTMEDRFSVIQQTPLVNQGFNLEGCKKELESFY